MKVEDSVMVFASEWKRWELAILTYAKPANVLQRVHGNIYNSLTLLMKVMYTMMFSFTGSKTL